MYDFEINICRRLQESSRRDLPRIQDIILERHEQEIKELKSIVQTQNEKIKDLEQNNKTNRFSL